MEVSAEATAQKIVEVALVNQLAAQGTFILLSKEAVQAARSAPEQEPTDWKGTAKRAGADYALRIKVLQFDAETRTGFSSVEEEDSQLAAERGEKEAKTQRLYKVRSLAGKVRVELEFNGVAEDTETTPRSAIAEAEDTITAEGRSDAPHLPPKLRFLETLTNTAFQKFFEQYR